MKSGGKKKEIVSEDIKDTVKITGNKGSSIKPPKPTDNKGAAPAPKIPDLNNKGTAMDIPSKLLKVEGDYLTNDEVIGALKSWKKTIK